MGRSSELYEQLQQKKIEAQEAEYLYEQSLKNSDAKKTEIEFEEPIQIEEPDEATDYPSHDSGYEIYDEPEEAFCEPIEACDCENDCLWDGQEEFYDKDYLCLTCELESAIDNAIMSVLDQYAVDLNNVNPAAVSTLSRLIETVENLR